MNKKLIDIATDISEKAPLNGNLSNQYFENTCVTMIYVNVYQAIILEE